MARGDLLEQGRAAFRAKAWAEAHATLSMADRREPLAPEDLECLSVAGELLGRSDFLDPLTRAHQGFLAAENHRRAARTAFWLGFTLMNRGERAQAGGWFARAARVLETAGLDCAERGYLLLPAARRSLLTGDAAAAHEGFAAAAAIGLRFEDRDLVALSRHGMGRAALMQGRMTEGTSLLDEAMVGVLAGEVSPVISGIIYCSVIEGCHQILDVGRAREWTAALADWCAAQPDMVPFQGHCQIRRAELLQLSGDWAGAEYEAGRVSLQDDPGPWSPAGEARYRMAELHRLRGKLADADKGYAEAADRGRRPNPGLALLRMAQGQLDVAAAAVRRAAAEARDLRERSLAGAACVEILLAAGDVPGAREAADQLQRLATGIQETPPLLRALTAQARGAVLLAEGQPETGLGELRRALSLWREIEAPYEEARVRELIARASEALNDRAAAELEFAAARRLLQKLGATADLDRLAGAAGTSRHGNLTTRELEVLRLVASGRTNRAIAEALHISEKTVARHVANIFTKVGLPNRAAATAYAYQAGLISAST